jgi:hypothetical protein
VLLAQAPQIYQQLSGGIRTNMTFDEAIQFGLLAKDIARENILMGKIAPPDQVLFAKSPDGTQDILKPIPDKIRETRDIFGSYQPLFQTSTPLLMKGEVRASSFGGTWVGWPLPQQYLANQRVTRRMAGSPSLRGVITPATLPCYLVATVIPPATFIQL